MSEKEKLFMDNEKLVYFTIKTYFPQLMFDDDWEQTARLFLWKACLKYVPEKGIFSSYAVRTMRHGISNTIRVSHAQKRGGYSTESEYDDTILPDSVKYSYVIDWCDRDGFFNAIPEYCRDVVRMSEYGYNKSEIGKRLGISCEAVRKRLAKCQKAAIKYL